MNGMTKRVVVGEAVALVAWLIVILACQNVLMSPFVFYTSLLFGLLAFVVSAVSMALADRQGGSRAMTETGFGLCLLCLDFRYAASRRERGHLGRHGDRACGA